MTSAVGEQDQVDLAVWRRGFLIWTLLAAAVVVALVFGITRIVGAEFTSAGSGAVAAAVTSTAGWLLVIRGFSDVPGRMVGYFVAGMLLKLVLIGVSAVTVAAVPGLVWDEFLVPYAGALVGIGMVQLVLVARLSTRLTDNMSPERDEDSAKDAASSGEMGR